MGTAGLQRAPLAPRPAGQPRGDAARRCRGRERPAGRHDVAGQQLVIPAGEITETSCTRPISASARSLMCSWTPPGASQLYGQACGVPDSATIFDQGFYAARSYSLMRRLRTGQRLIRF